KNVSKIEIIACYLLPYRYFNIGKQKSIWRCRAPIHQYGLEKLNARLLNKQNKSHADGFIVCIQLKYVTCITYFLKSLSRSVVCREADE
ncbi:hypothetical protein SR02_002270, partial [Salmonella enterica subsp. arizonae]|nr:hypothetical protein [Salmonella enterica subsp. arizonae]